MRTQFSAITLVAALFILSSIPFVVKADDLNLKIKAGTEVTVDRYLPESRAFELTINDEPGVGPNWVSSENLHRALALEENLKSFEGNAKRVEGHIFTLVEPVPLLTQKELGQRKSVEKKSSNKSKK